MKERLLEFLRTENKSLLSLQKKLVFSLQVFHIFFREGIIQVLILYLKCLKNISFFLLTGFCLEKERCIRRQKCSHCLMISTIIRTAINDAPENDKQEPEIR